MSATVKAPREVVEAIAAHAGPDAAGLWAEASFRLALAMGLTSEEYLKWARAGVWNVAGDPGHRWALGVLRTLVGERGWVFPAAGIDPATAAVQVAQNGVDGAVEGARALAALRDLAGEDSGEPPPRGHGRIAGALEPLDFS